MSNKIQPQWNFVSTGGGDMDGLNNSMIEHFTGNYNYFLAREIIQNSLDAKNKANEPVKVVFSLELFEKNDFPGIKQLESIYESAKQMWTQNKKALQFLNNACHCLKEPKIPFLRISDYNTTGLGGTDSDMAGGWFNLVRSTGASPKQSGEGGSFGIGKGAPFAASDLRVVFYSTDVKGFKKFQGKAELVSFKSEDNDIKRGVGSFGIGQNSVQHLIDIPERFHRKQQGTDIVIAGYKISDDWVEDLIKSILRNFWYAIYRNDLIVVVEGSTITSETLESYLTTNFANEPFKDYVKPTGNPLQYYLAIKEGKELGNGQHVKNVGECSFYFRPVELHMNYVAMIRKSHMVIYSRPFVFPTNFAGVFICDDKDGNIELSKMEPPAHNEWDPKRNDEKGEKIITEITRFIRECLVKVKENQTYEPLEIPELYKYLPYDEGDQNESDGSFSDEGSVYTGKEGVKETSHLIQKETFENTAVINPTKVSVLNEKIETGGSDPGEGLKNRNGNGGTKKAGGGLGNKLSTKKKNFHYRSFIVGNDSSKIIYKIIVSSEKDAKCILKFSAVGEEGNIPLNLIDVYDNKHNKFMFSKNKIQQLKLKQSEKKAFFIVIESPIKVALNIEANDLQQ